MMIRKLTIRSVVMLGITLVAPASFATDGAESALERWQADPTVFLDARDVALTDFKWLARPIVVFADTEADPAYRRQIELLRARIGELAERDVVVIMDPNPAEKTDVRRTLRPRGFTLTLIGKDGRVVLRKPFPWDVRELSRSIDKLPLRQQELRER